MSKIKSIFYEHKRDFVLLLLVLLVAAFSFGLGYLLAGEIDKSPIIIEKCFEK